MAHANTLGSFVYKDNSFSRNTVDPPGERAREESRAPVIAAAGGGASGTLAAIYLLREAAGRHLPLPVAPIDRHGARHIELFCTRWYWTYETATPARNGGDARVADVEAGSLTVTASHGGTAPDRRIFVAGYDPELASR
jgi:hypothetical protein